MRYGVRRKIFVSREFYDFSSQRSGQPAEEGNRRDDYKVIQQLLIQEVQLITNKCMLIIVCIVIGN